VQSKQESKACKRHDCKQKHARQRSNCHHKILSFVTTPQFQRLARTKEQQRSNNNNNKSQL